MTVEELHRDWQDYAIEVTHSKITRKLLALKETFTACIFLPKKYWQEDALDFDTGLPIPGLNYWEGTKMFRMKTDKDNLCYLWDQDCWIVIGRFIKLPATSK